VLSAVIKEHPPGDALSDFQPADAESIVRVILADDHEIVRDGIRMILEPERDIEVIAEVGDAESARRRTSDLKPDVLVLDLNMPDGSSLPTIPAILEASPQTAVVALTMQDEPGFAREAFRLGARGYVLKHSIGRELIEAIRAAFAGRTYTNPEIAERLVTGVRI
jgi:two-component system, NarL family, response regulator NreC